MFARSTQRTYDAAWASYRQWCDANKLTIKHGDPIVIAKYLESTLSRLSFNSVRTHLTAIAGKYRAIGVPIDTKHRAIVEIVSSARHRYPETTQSSAPLVPKQLIVMLRYIPDTVIGSRDRALLLVGYWLGLNLLDLAKIDMENLVRRGENMVLEDGQNATTSQTGRRAVLRPCFVPEACPLRAIESWVAVRGDHRGPLFPRILKGGKITRSPISGAYINLLVKRLADAAGFKPGALSGRSLRSAIGGMTIFRLPTRPNWVPELEDQSIPALSETLERAKRRSEKFDKTQSMLPGPLSSDQDSPWEIRLGIMIDELSRLQSAAVTESMKHIGTTRIQYIALSEITKSNGLTQADLGRRLNLTKEGVSGLVSRLVNGGWVTRQADQIDGRVRCIYLTDKAHELMIELRRISEEVTSSTFRHISKETGSDLLRVLGGMKNVLLGVIGSMS